MDLSLILYLHTLKLNLSTIGVLRYYEKEMEYFLPAKHRLKNDLEKYGYVHNNSITEKGRQLLEEIDNWSEIYTPQGRTKKKEIIYSPEFLEWWNLYPVGDDFEDWRGTRDLRKDKEKCFVLFDIFAEELGANALIDALEYEVSLRKEQTREKGINQLTFMKTSYNYLKQESFRKYIGKKSSNNKSNTIVI